MIKFAPRKTRKKARGKRFVSLKPTHTQFKGRQFKYKLNQLCYVVFYKLNIKMNIHSVSLSPRLSKGEPFIVESAAFCVTKTQNLLFLLLFRINFPFVTQERQLPHLFLRGVIRKRRAYFLLYLSELQSAAFYAMFKTSDASGCNCF